MSLYKLLKGWTSPAVEAVEGVEAVEASEGVEAVEAVAPVVAVEPVEYKEGDEVELTPEVGDSLVAEGFAELIS